MAALKQKGDLAELMVAADIVRQGHRIALPWGEDNDYDLIVDRDGHLERVQVKHARSDGTTIVVRCRSHSLTNGRVRRTKHYTAATIDWLAVYDATTAQCYYVPASELGEGRSMIHLRLRPTARNRRDTRHAAEYRSLESCGIPAVHSAKTGP
ncbi:MAG TPA: group I intron-associated PD-(D/E)XK endonuclease [Solirubrobacteraceae bacterium]|nr:group I intron-associated PD-(D/E)XK endonuclease [Solirubrobacteraceae bacterium]